MKYEVKLILEDTDLDITPSDVRELLENELRHLQTTRRIDITIQSVRTTQD